MHGIPMQKPVFDAHIECFKVLGYPEPIIQMMTVLSIIKHERLVKGRGHKTYSNINTC